MQSQKMCSTNSYLKSTAPVLGLADLCSNNLERLRAGVLELANRSSSCPRAVINRKQRCVLNFAKPQLQSSRFKSWPEP
ncbi:hypothetical protein M758_UG316800 [Ceratodon purpureus]|nr:hypothetical protein M758_UG316800 [Ceratodon purpureus]